MGLLFFFWTNVVLPTFDLVMDVLTAEKILAFYFDATSNQTVAENEEVNPEFLKSVAIFAAILTQSYKRMWA